MASYTTPATFINSAILDSLDVGIAVYDRQGNYIFVNTALVKERNISRAEFLKMNIHDFLGVLDICVFDLVMEQKRSVTRLQKYKGYNSVGENHRLRIVTGSPIFDENGTIQYVVHTLQDTDSFFARYNHLLKENQIISSSVPAPRSDKAEIITVNSAFKELLQITESVASIDSTILLCGESGCGKDVLAHYIHEHSSRSKNSMITVNCAAFPENLIESELFGYEKGAFTGASREGKAGLIEAANGGTLFLDEINSLPLNVQGKFLRSLEERSVMRIGSTKTKKVDFRLIAATNRDLFKMVQEGTFREDLYYRIQVIPITIPPLRNRREDIVPLCLYFLRYFSEKYNIRKTFSDQVLEEVTNYDWPGNVREVRNFVERMVVMTPRSEEVLTQIPQGILKPDDQKITLKKTSMRPPVTVAVPANGKYELTKERIIEALEACGHHRARTAEYLGISRRYLQYKIKEYHISSRCRYDT